MGVVWTPAPQRLNYRRRWWDSEGVSAVNPVTVRGNIRETLKRFRIGFGYQVNKGEIEKWEDKDNSWFAAVFFWVAACWKEILKLKEKNHIRSFEFDFLTDAKRGKCAVVVVVVTFSEGVKTFSTKIKTLSRPNKHGQCLGVIPLQKQQLWVLKTSAFLVKNKGQCIEPEQR